MNAMVDYLPAMLSGLKVTVLLTLGAMAVAFVAAFVAGMARLSRRASVRGLALVYIELFRGTSALVQLFWVYFALPLVGIRFDAVTAGILVLGLNTGAYGAEVVRGALSAVPREQYQAAWALNLSPAQALWRVILPQAVIAMVPPAGNLAIELLKNTALVSLITLGDLTFQAQTLRAATLESGPVFALLLGIYFLLAQTMRFGFRRLENRLAHGQDYGGVR
jgi:polar amino acid transport system permease protein